MPDEEAQTLRDSAHGGMVRGVMRLLRSPELQSASQLTLGLVIVQLFSMIDRLTFSLACLAVIWLPVMLLLGSSHGSAGARTFAAIAPTALLIWGMVLAGALLSLARVNGGQHRTVLQCIFGAAFLLPAVAVRIGKSLPHMGGGLMLHLGFGLMFLYAQNTWPASLLWKQVGQGILGAVISSGATLLAGYAIFPSSSALQARKLMAKLCCDSSQLLTSLLLPATYQLDADLEKTGGKTMKLQIPPNLLLDPDLATYRQVLLGINPSNPAHLQKLPSGVTFAGILQDLKIVKGLVLMAQFELPILTKVHQAASRWTPVALKLESVCQAVEMLESVAQQGLQVYEPAHQYAFKSKTREVLHNVHKMIRLRLLACAKALIEHQAPDGSDWESQQQMLLTGVEAMCQEYWGKHTADGENKEYPHLIAVDQASSVMFLVTATSNLLDATGSLEACIVTAMQADSSGVKAWIICLITLGVLATLHLIALRIYDILWIQLRRSLSSWCACSRMLQDTDFQFGIKQYLIAAGAMVLIINLNAHYSDLQGWSLYAGFVAVTLIHYKALEVTVSSAITRAIGALLGATLGYIYLLRADLADEPVALVVVVAATNFLLAWYSWCRWRMGIFYAVLNLNLVVFCQYRLHPDHTGTLQYWGSRSANVVCGGLAAVLVSLVLPYSSRSKSLDSIRDLLVQAARHLQDHLDTFHSIETQQADSHPAKAALPTLMPASILAQSAAVMEEVSAALTPSTGLTGDRTVWASGPLAPSPTLFQLLPACQLLHLRLAALELSCKQTKWLAYTSDEHQANLYRTDVYKAEVIQPLYDCLTGLLDTYRSTLIATPADIDNMASNRLERIVDSRVMVYKSMVDQQTACMHKMHMQSAAPAPCKTVVHTLAFIHAQHMLLDQISAMLALV